MPAETSSSSFPVKTPWARKGSRTLVSNNLLRCDAGKGQQTMLRRGVTPPLSSHP